MQTWPARPTRGTRPGLVSAECGRQHIGNDIDANLVSCIACGPFPLQWRCRSTTCCKAGCCKNFDCRVDDGGGAVEQECVKVYTGTSGAVKGNGAIIPSVPSSVW